MCSDCIKDGGTVDATTERRKQEGERQRLNAVHRRTSCPRKLRPQYTHSLSSPFARFSHFNFDIYHVQECECALNLEKKILSTLPSGSYKTVTDIS